MSMSLDVIEPSSFARNRFRFGPVRAERRRRLRPCFFTSTHAICLLIISIFPIHHALNTLLHGYSMPFSAISES